MQLNDNPTIRLDLDNEPQPDAALLIDPDRGGQARVSEDDYIEGAPELVEGIYRPRVPDATGLVRSRVFPGLCLATDALLRGDLRAVLEAQQRGLDDPAHAAFVGRLRGPAE